jgi:hypothetical protein
MVRWVTLRDSDRPRPGRRMSDASWPSRQEGAVGADTRRISDPKAAVSGKYADQRLVEMSHGKEKRVRARASRPCADLDDLRSVIRRDLPSTDRAESAF